MTALNFDTEDDNVITIRAMARDDFDTYDERLDFDAAAARRGFDDELTRAVEELGDEEAAEIYESALDAIESGEDDYRD